MAGPISMLSFRAEHAEVFFSHSAGGCHSLHALMPSAL